MINGQNLNLRPEYAHCFEDIKGVQFRESIQSICSDARVVGLGENSHYTKECYELKFEAIKALIEKGFNALVLEVDFGQALLWNNYITKDEGDLDSLIARSGWFTYRTEEFKKILSYLNEYNKTASDQFQVFGMEMTAINHNLTWLVDYLKENRLGSNELISELQSLEKTIVFQSFTDRERLEFWNVYYELKKTIDPDLNNQKQIIAERMIEIFKQFCTYISQDEFVLQVELRDQFSVRNALWCLDKLGEEGKLIIWAHNGHVVKESVLFDYDILGHYLSNWFGEEYISIGFTFNKGDFGAFSNSGFLKWTMPDVDSASITQELKSFECPFLVYDVKSHLVIDKNLNSFLRTLQVIRTDVSESRSENSPDYMEINLSKSYDALIFMNETHYPTTIDWLVE